MNAAGVSILVVLAILVLAGSKRVAALGMLGGVLFLTAGQHVYIGGLNVFAIRFLELAGIVRVLSRREFSFARLNQIDRAVLLLYSFVIIVYCARSTDGKAYIIGQAFDSWLCYFTFRGLITNLEEFKLFLKSFLVLLAPYTVMVLYESVTHNNAFAFVGGGGYQWIRNGRFRCIGSFRNPDLLGTLGASFLPLYIGLACIKTDRRTAGLGITCCLLIVWACNSGGAMSAAALAALGWLMWRKIRTKMQTVRRLIAAWIILMSLVMKAPIWYLLAHVSELTGGDGWHRAYLLDVSFQHLNLWWLSGMPMIDTADWFQYRLADGADITNEFLLFGLNAGLAAIVLFIILLKRGFSQIGKALAVIRSRIEEPVRDEFMVWSLGVMLTTHIVNWMGISYFDQIYMVWFLQLAVISGVCANIVASSSNAPEVIKVAEEKDAFELEHVEHVQQSFQTA